MRMKGFVLTVDALLALGLAATALVALSALTPQYDPDYSAMAILGHDFLAHPGLSRYEFTALTGLRLAYDKNAAAQLKVRAVYYAYSWNCRDKIVQPADCFTKQDVAAANSLTEAWVTP